MGTGVLRVVVAGVIVGGLVMSGDVGAAGDSGLDTSFGDGGIVTTAVAEFAGGRAVAVQSDGKIVVAGLAGSGTADVLLARYDGNGSLDPTFGDGGVVTTATGDSSSGDAVALQPDGKIVVAGTRGGRGSENIDVLLLRYNADGSLDPTFGEGGVVTTEAGTSSRGNSVALQPDGKILVAGEARLRDDVLLVVRYDAEGSLDPTFGEGGIVTTAVADRSSTGSSMALQSDGKIVVTGTAGFGDPQGVLVVRYDADGSLDPTFGDGGVVVTDHANGDTARSVVVQSDGKIAIAGGTFAGPGDQNPLVLLARYDADGMLDPSFGEGGIVTADLHSFPHFDHHEALLGVAATSLAVQSAGELVTAGSWGDEGHLFVLRFDQDGVPDTSFGRDGAAFVDAGGERSYALALQADDKPVVAGTSCSGQAILCGSTEPDQVLVARFGTAEVGLVPEFDAPLSTTDGFTVQVVNHDPTFTWSVETNAGDATIDANGLVTVSGLGPAGSATVTVSTLRPGYEGAAASVTGSSLANILPPTGNGSLTTVATGTLLLGTFLLIVSSRRRTA